MGILVTRPFLPTESQPYASGKENCCKSLQDYYTDSSSKGKHGSDSESYTTTGEFDESRFTSIFNMYSQPPHDKLSFVEGVRMIHGNMNPFDPVSFNHFLVSVMRL